MTTYRLKKIGKKLKTGRCAIAGMLRKDQFGDRKYIIDDYDTCTTYHVYESSRPRWLRYLRVD